MADGGGRNLLIDPPEPPRNVEAEQALLGAIMVNNAVMDRDVVALLEPEHFSYALHRQVFHVMRGLRAKGMLVEPTTLAEYFRDEKLLTDAGGPVYLARMMAAASTIINSHQYAVVVRDMAVRRRLVEAAQAVMELAQHPTADATIEEIVAASEASLAAVSSGLTMSRTMVHVSKALDGAISQAEAAYKANGRIVGAPTGLEDLDRKLGGLHRSNLVILAGRPGMGKAQPTDAKVLMRDGTWRAIGDLRLGDEIASVDGAPSRVAGIFPQGRKPMFRVTLGDGRSTRACGEHLWTITSSKFEGQRTVETSALRAMLEKERYRRRIALPLVSGHFGQDDGLLVDPWLLGALIGNGCLRSGHMRISTADAATLFRVQNVVGHDRVVSAGGDGYDYRISQAPDLGLRAALVRYGLFGKLSQEKFIPPDYLSATREVRLELLRGLLDTDGWVEKTGVVRYCTSSARLSVDLQALVRSLGGACTVSVKRPTFTSEGKKKAGLPAYVCNIRHPDRASLISLKRKQRRCEAPSQFKAPTVVSVEPDGEAEAVCIRVTHPSALYVTDDYIVTHNTAMAAGFARAAASAGRSVAFFSLEMSVDELGLRMIAEETGVSVERVRAARISADDIQDMMTARDQLAGLPMHIDDDGGASIAYIRLRCRQLHRVKPLGLIVVDYLQLIAARSRGDGNRVNEVSEITRALKMMAKEFDCPVLALSQLSRRCEEREDKRPQLSDLRESGSIEQDANVVLFVYREEVYTAREKPKESERDSAESHADKMRRWNDRMARDAGLAECIIAKNRNGATGTAHLHFDGPRTRFGNLVRAAQ